MRTSGCNREENWQKIGLFAYGCEGKKERVIKKQEKMINKMSSENLGQV